MPPPKGPSRSATTPRPRAITSWANAGRPKAVSSGRATAASVAAAQKGTRNLATDIRDEFEGVVTVTVGGVTKKVTRLRAMVMRLTDNAMKGQNSAIAAALELEERLVAPARRREEERKQAERKADYSCFSKDELQILRFLTQKAYGQTTNSDIVGVKAIYKGYGTPCSDAHGAAERAGSAPQEGLGIGSGVSEPGPDQT